MEISSGEARHPDAYAPSRVVRRAPVSPAEALPETHAATHERVMNRFRAERARRVPESRSDTLRRYFTACFGDPEQAGRDSGRAARARIEAIKQERTSRVFRLTAFTGELEKLVTRLERTASQRGRIDCIKRFEAFTAAYDAESSIRAATARRPMRDVPVPASDQSLRARYSPPLSARLREADVYLALHGKKLDAHPRDLAACERKFRLALLATWIDLAAPDLSGAQRLLYGYYRSEFDKGLAELAERSRTLEGQQPRAP